MINVEALTEAFDGDKEFVAAVFEQYLADNQDINVRIDEQFDNQQYDTLFHTMHSLSGALSNIFEEDIVDTIKKVELQARDQVQSSADDIEQIKTQLTKINTQITQYLA